MTDGRLTSCSAASSRGYDPHLALPEPSDPVHTPSTRLMSYDACTRDKESQRFSRMGARGAERGGMTHPGAPCARVARAGGGYRQLIERLL